MGELARGWPRGSILGGVDRTPSPPAGDGRGCGGMSVEKNSDQIRKVGPPQVTGRVAEM